MTPEQKQQAQQAIEGWQSVRNDDPMKPAGDVLAALLEELANAPEPEPFGYFKSEPFGWTDCAETDEGAIALYSAPPAPSVPDLANTFKRRAEEIVAMAMNRDNYAETNRLSAALIMDIANAAEATTPESQTGLPFGGFIDAAPTPAEAPADVARDAARYRWLRSAPEIGGHSVSSAEFDKAVDAAIAAEKGGA